jgi:CDP-glycerol glycerophosphotransferase
MKVALKRIAWRLLSFGLTSLTFVMPKRRHVVVSGFPPSEENASEVVRALLAGYSGRIHWIDAPPATVRDARSLFANDRLTESSYWSLVSLAKYVTAEAVFYTHGLYGNPRLKPNRAVVNLWHGHGLKKVSSPGYATHLVVGTKMHANGRSQSFGIPRQNVLSTGNPRVQCFSRRAEHQRLRSLGIDPDQPFVVWMPTYRKSSVATGPARSWTGATAIDESGSITREAALGFAVLARRGIQVVAKPHPADHASRNAEGALHIDDAALSKAGLGLYEFLGEAGGLITDYSSVWFDYLVLDRPIGFYCPDLEEYKRSRGIDPVEILDNLPGSILRDGQDWTRFAIDVLGGGAASTEIRRATRDFVGLTNERRPGDELVRAFTDEYGRFQWPSNLPHGPNR